MAGDRVRRRGVVAMSYARNCFTEILIFAGLLVAAPYDVSVEKVSNYDSWGTGWDSEYVMQNAIVTLAVVPKIGGRIMQFNLSTFISLYVDSTNKGVVPTSDILLGGYRTMVSPQSSFPWPPSPFLDWKPYSCTITTNTPDSCGLFLQSQIETTSGYSTLDGLQYKRTITIYKASSHVQVLTTLVNKGTSAIDTPHGIWDDAECTCITNNLPDTTNMWVYFPLNPGSAMGKGRGYAQLQDADTTQWKRNIAPGIMGVQYKKKAGKIGADSKGGWICYVNRLDGHAYVKRFTYVQGQTYPDSGSSVEVYTDPTDPFLEDEVMGPLVPKLEPNDSIQFSEDWFSARTFGPVLAVGAAGLTTHSLTVKQSRDTAVVTGTYGVFDTGTVKSVFRNAAGATLAVADSYSVSPIDSFVLSDKLLVPANASSLQLALYTTMGNFVGALDSVPVTSTAVAGGREGLPQNAGETVTISTMAHALSIHIPFCGHYSIDLLRLDGKRIARYSGAQPGDYMIPYAVITSGVCVIRIKSPTFNESRRLFIP